ncbi:regulatory protein ToxS [Vibrio sp. JC009]|uniref:regulatory protein ToxS n=1 Tax=Vibrio sp. JC009 TaxID=2912314 RepID=UPI0023AF9CC7|nr:regulatory protein ToxS [Vibrio sp. JC009]WED20993.1 regulatory protein ToxS [Vibrio sp. JC009]
MKQRIALVTLVLSCIFSLWLYFASDIKIERELTSKEWQSTMTTLLSETIVNDPENPLNQLARVTVRSNVKYLPNYSYIRVSYIELFDKEQTLVGTLGISETGSWELSDQYLLVNPAEFKDSSAPRPKTLSQEQVDIIKGLFVSDAQQSRRVDVINSRAILLTSLDHGSRVLSSN